MNTDQQTKMDQLSESGYYSPISGASRCVITHSAAVVLTILIVIFSYPLSLAKAPLPDSDTHDGPFICGIHTLSIHVRDTLVHDSVYQFLQQDLKLPTYFGPLKIGVQKYVGLYAGNMVLEPCGPYENIDYAGRNFRSIFYGLNFEVCKSLDSVSHIIEKRGISQQVNKGSIYIKDHELTSENVFAGLYEVEDQGIRDSLSLELISNQEDNPGILYVKEIFIGYKAENFLLKWKKFLFPLEINPEGICKITDSLNLHFKRSRLNELQGVSFKVRSQDHTIKHFANRGISVSREKDKIKLDQKYSFGLSIYFTDKE